MKSRCLLILRTTFLHLGKIALDLQPQLTLHALHSSGQSQAPVQPPNRQNGLRAVSNSSMGWRNHIYCLTFELSGAL